MNMIRKFESLRSGKYDDYYVLKDGKIDYSATDAMKANGFYDSYFLHHNGFTSSFTTRKYQWREGPDGRDIRIDYIWLNRVLKNKTVRSDIIKDEVTHELSDHYPVLLQLKP